MESGRPTRGAPEVNGMRDDGGNYSDDAGLGKGVLLS